MSVCRVPHRCDWCARIMGSMVCVVTLGFTVMLASCIDFALIDAVDIGLFIVVCPLLVFLWIIGLGLLIFGDPLPEAEGDAPS